MNLEVIYIFIKIYIIVFIISINIIYYFIYPEFFYKIKKLFLIKINKFFKTKKVLNKLINSLKQKHKIGNKKINNKNISIFNIANLFTLYRMLFLLPFVFLAGISGDNFLLLIVIINFLILDVIDGMVARKMKICSEFGRILDIIADKLLIIILGILLIYNNLLSVGLLITILLIYLLIAFGNYYLGYVRSKNMPRIYIFSGLLMFGIIVYFFWPNSFWYLFIIFFTFQILISYLFQIIKNRSQLF